MAYKTLTLNKILIIIILSLLVNGVNGQKFMPGPREGHTATLLRGKIYYIGGVSLSAIDLTAADFFYLDEKFTWVDLKNQTKLTVSVYHTSEIGGANQDSIFIIGGLQLDNTNLVYKFDAKTNAITPQIIQGKEPPRRQNIGSVSYAGKIYIFSGRTFDSISNSNTIFNNFDILDTVNMNWQVGSLINAPLPRFGYTATLVSGVIYYIGGIRQYGITSQVYELMSNIYQYDIIGNTWTAKIATAAKTMPGQRVSHSAVLVNGKICIYGGTYFPTGALRSMSSAEPIAMLDTTTLVWSIPTLQDSNIPSLVFHTATLYDKSTMLLAFGNVTNLPGGTVYNDKFYLFDFGEPNIKWKSFTAQEIGKAKALQSPPNPTGGTSSTNNADQPQSSSPSKALVIGLSVGLIAAGIAVFSLIYIHRKKNKKNENVSAGRGPDVFPADGEHYPVNQQYSPQFAPQYQYSKSQEDPHSHTATLTEHFPSQEFSTLPSSQERFSQYSSNYSSEFKTLPPPPPKIPPTIYRSNYSPGSETSSPPPPPPKTLPTTFDIHVKQASNYSHYSSGSETSSPPPLPSKTLPTTFDIHATNQQASNCSPGSETPPSPSSKIPQTTFNIHGTNQQPSNYFSVSEIPPPPPPKTPPINFNIHGTNQQAY